VSAWGISDIQIATIDAIVSIFESERPGDYGAIARDPNDAGGLSYGKHQAALTKGTLFNLISDYCQAGEAQCAAEFQPFLPKIEARDRALDNDKTLYALLKKAALDPVMQRVQDLFFNDSYMKPALTKWQELGFQTALAAGVIYDSYIHSGGLNMMNRTVAKYGQPAAQSEKEWIAGYVAVRKDWLTQNYPSTAVRMKTFESLIQNGNWDLKLPIRVIRSAGSYPLTAYDLGAHLFESAIRRLGPAGFGVARLGDYPGVNGRDKWLQTSLAGLGYLSAADVDGRFGKGTAAAVKAFQKDCGLPQTGEVDGRCFDKLCAQVEEKGSTSSGAAQSTDHGLVELPPEKRTSTTASKTGAGVAAGAAGVAGVAGAAASGGEDHSTTAGTAEADATQATTAADGSAAAAAPAGAPDAAAQPAAASTATSTAAPPPPTPGDQPAAGQTAAQAASQTASAPASGQPAAPAAAGVNQAMTASAGAPQQVALPFGIHVSEGVLALTTAALFVTAVVLFAHGRRRSY
jgi:chitosanase